MSTVVQYSGLPIDDHVVGRYYSWFVGKEFGWKTTDGPDWAGGHGTDWVASLGRHLAVGRDSRLRRFSLHMGPKAGVRGGQPFYWTRFVAIDIDARAGQPNGSVRERYDACLRALGTVPLVLRSPRRGLHLYVPLAEPMSTLGLTHTYQPGLPVLVPHVLGAEGLEVLRCYQQPDEATMFNVVMSGHELRERRA